MPKKFWVVVLAAVILSVTLLVGPVSADQGSAQNAINQGKNTLKKCYTAISAAESAGANVTSLMNTLNGAAETLSKAELAYSSRNYDSAFTYASQIAGKLSGFESQAETLRQTAIASTSQNELVTSALLAASIALTCAGVAVWIILNRRERRSSYGSVSL